MRVLFSARNAQKKTTVRYPETARRLREARLEKGLSQIELVRMASRHGSITPAAVSNYEQGIRVPSSEIANILEKTLGLPAAYWMGEISKQEGEVIAALRRATKG